MSELIEKFIKPETELEKSIVADPDFIAGTTYGKPRKGHPEGEVIYHIGEVLANVEKFANTQDREDLRLIAIIHDTFKYKVDGTQPKTGENHHGMIARRFAEKHKLPLHLLEIIELHDEAYNAWSKGDRDGKWEGAKKRADQLIKRLDDNLELYLKFYKCDNQTGDKAQDNYDWFNDIIAKS